jgi:hypothetical protein
VKSRSFFTAAGKIFGKKADEIMKNRAMVSVLFFLLFVVMIFAYEKTETGGGTIRHAAAPAPPVKKAQMVKKKKAAVKAADLKMLFKVPCGKDMQGVAYDNGCYYIGFDLHKSAGSLLCKLNSAGKLISKAVLSLGHCSEIAVNHSNGDLFVSNGSFNRKAHVYEVDFRNGKKARVVKDINLSRFGNSALVAVDNSKKYLVVHTSKNDFSTHDFTILRMSDLSVVKRFQIKYQGIPQGLDISAGRIYFCTDNKLTVMNDSGKIIRSIRLKEHGENEGIAFATIKGKQYLVVGYSRPNRLYVLKY